MSLSFFHGFPWFFYVWPLHLVSLEMSGEGLGKAGEILTEQLGETLEQVDLGNLQNPHGKPWEIHRKTMEYLYKIYKWRLRSLGKNLHRSAGRIFQPPRLGFAEGSLP